MQPTSHAFKANVREALQDETLQRALGNMKTGFIGKRLAAVARLPEFEALRDQGRAIKNHTLEHLDFYLEMFERNVTAAGGKVHWARTAEEARQIVLGICRSVDAKTVTKGKSMISEEIALNEFLEAEGLVPVETDLGEYIIQLRHEAPSHIIAPAIHLVKEQVEEAFRATHTDLPADRPLSEPRELTDEARAVLRRRFLEADVGLTGANFLIAETGSTVIVTNEGNGDLTQTLPKVHVVLASLEKVVPRSRMRPASCACSPARPRARNSRRTRPSRPGRAGRATSTGPANSTSCSWTMAARRCSARNSRTCCAASAARPASTTARSINRLAAMPMAGSIRDPWARS
jgi:L-lactate dehydrogenase complex protein LldF